MHFDCRKPTWMGLTVAAALCCSAAFASPAHAETSSDTLAARAALLGQNARLSPVPLIDPNAVKNICDVARDLEPGLTNVRMKSIPRMSESLLGEYVTFSLSELKLRRSERPVIDEKAPLPPAIWNSVSEPLRKSFKQAPNYGQLVSGEALDRAAAKVESALGVPRKKARPIIHRCFRGEAWEGSIGGAVSAAAGISAKGPIASGLANFVADRAQQELLEWLKQQVFSELCKDPLGKLAFANTCDAVEQGNQNANGLGRYFAGMIRKDLEAAPAIMAYMGLRQLQPSAQPVASDPLLKTLRHMSALVAGMKRGDSPLELLAALGDEAAKEQALCQKDRADVSCALALAGLWVKFLGGIKDLDKAAFANPETIDEQLELILSNQSFQTALKATLNVKDGDVSNVASWVAPFLTDLTKRGSAAAGSPAGGADAIKPAREAVRLVFASVVALESRLKKFNAMQDKGVVPTVEWTAEVASLTLDVLDSTLSLVKAVKPAAGSEAAVEKIDAQIASLKHVFAAIAAFARADYAVGVRETLDGMAKYSDKLPKSVQQFLPLLADLAAATTVEEVQVALNSAAAPLGSWRAKRRQPFSASISALAGLSGSWEAPMSSRLNFAQNSGLAGGPLAAVGFDFAWRAQKTSDWTVGLFISVLDVGQLAYARATNAQSTSSDGSTSSADTASNVSLLSVLAPGAFFRVGAANTPLTFGVGAAVAPQMRQYLFKSSSGLEDSGFFSMFRVMAFIAVDVTLFRLN